MADHVKIIEIIATAIGTLGAKYGIDFFTSKRKANRVDFETILNRLDKELAESKEERVVLRTENEKLKEEQLQLRADLISLRNKIILLESAQNDSPLPMWLKDTDGTMLALNGAYEEMFLIPNGLKMQDYIGKTDYDIWPEEIAKQYRAHDSKVYKSGKTFKGPERVVVNGEDVPITVIKYVRYSGNLKIGIAGIAIPKEWVA